jgi:hypothetical protein
MLEFGMLLCLGYFPMKKRASETNLTVSDCEKGSGIQWIQNINRFLKPFDLKIEKIERTI